MIRIIGPADSYDLGWAEHEPAVDPMMVHVKTGGEALNIYASAHGVQIDVDKDAQGNARGKYFTYQQPDSTSYALIDVHVRRAGKDICIKQDLGFKLESGDTLVLGQLVC